MTPAPSRYDRDPDALAWARAKVAVLESRWRVIAAFDERRAALSPVPDGEAP